MIDWISATDPRSARRSLAWLPIAVGSGGLAGFVLG
jgi:hypothetical protein